MTDEGNMSAVFKRARQSAPCTLVLEDLDSLLTPSNRAYFLNELDGFATNTGIVTLATTNHPEKLDASILERPSRFDRKYHFDIPQQPERLAYITLWNKTLKPSLRISEEGAARLSEATPGFSFAYLELIRKLGFGLRIEATFDWFPNRLLKELFLSSMMRWISSAAQGTMEQTLLDQVNTLREQMSNLAHA
jgi:hypothetical protein